MAKIRTLEHLEDFISDEISWRKQELTTARKLVQQTTGSVQTAHLRAGVLILYAHWEGWIKNVARLYVRYVNTSAPTFDQLSVAFLGHALKVRLSSVQESSTALTHNEFAEFLHLGLSEKARLDESLVRTNSNLSSTVLGDILTRLGLSARSEYSTRAKLIDEELVARRNAIAHGQHLDLTDADFLQLQTDIITLLELFTDEVRNAASQQKYLRLNVSE